MKVYYTPAEHRELLRRALELMCDGATMRKAAARVGIAESTLCKWRKQGKNFMAEEYDGERKWTWRDESWLWGINPKYWR